MFNDTDVPIKLQVTESDYSVSTPVQRSAGFSEEARAALRPTVCTSRQRAA